MTATWYLVRYMPDLQRREPRNIGLVLRTADGTWLSKFVGQRPDGVIDSRSLRTYAIHAEVYKTWVTYFARKANDDSWCDVARRQAARSTNYVVEPGGEYLGTVTSWQSLLEELYAELVDRGVPARPRPEKVLDKLVARVDHVLDLADVAPQRAVIVEAKFGDELDEVPFRYSYTNGQVHLMDLVTSKKNPAEAARDARELRARVQGARDAGSARSFVAFYDRMTLPESELEHILRPVEGLSRTVDVADETEATVTIRSLMTHHH